MENMAVKILIVSAGLVCFLCSGAPRESISNENNIREEDFDESLHYGALEPTFFYGLSGTGLEKLPLDALEIGKTVDDEKEREKLSESEVDEETIRKAEKMADKDLLNGLNRILKNNESLEDIFRSENVDEIP